MRPFNEVQEPKRLLVFHIHNSRVKNWVIKTFANIVIHCNQLKIFIVGEMVVIAEGFWWTIKVWRGGVIHVGRSCFGLAGSSEARRAAGAGSGVEVALPPPAVDPAAHCGHALARLSGNGPERHASHPQPH